PTRHRYRTLDPAPSAPSAARCRPGTPLGGRPPVPLHPPQPLLALFMAVKWRPTREGVGDHMGSSAEERRFEVLRAIVADFVRTKEPIGSKTLVERHNLGVSSATVRNDMAVLEAEGYITQPHTSSGRAPTEKGYREFVDRLDEIKPLSASERSRSEERREGEG